MRVLLVSRDFRFKGGVVNFARLLLKYAPEYGIEIVHFIEGKNPTKKHNVLLPFRIIHQYISFSKVITKNIDVVHLNPSMGPVPMWRDGLYLRMAKKKNKPVLFFIHGWEDTYFDSSVKHGLFSKFHKKTLQMADSIVVLSPDFKKKLVEIGINGNKIHILTTMVEVDKYRPEKKDFSPPYKLLFCGRLVKEKGVYEAIEAMKYIIRDFPDTTLTVMGSGPELNNLKTFAKKLGVEKNVIFTGYLSGKKKYDIFKQSHIFIFPSYSEGFPTVILEAMAAGMVIVTTPVGGLKSELQEGTNAIIVEYIPPPPNILGRSITKLFYNTNTMKKISDENTIKTYKKYNVSSVIKKIKNVYSETIK